MAGGTTGQARALGKKLRLADEPQLDAWLRRFEDRAEAALQAAWQDALRTGGYRRLAEDEAADVLEAMRWILKAFVHCVRRGTPFGEWELAQLRRLAAKRARQGVPLADLRASFRAAFARCASDFIRIALEVSGPGKAAVVTEFILHELNPLAAQVEDALPDGYDKVGENGSGGPPVREERAVRVLLVEGSQLSRAALEALIKDRQGFVGVGRAMTMADVDRFVMLRSPDVCLLDATGAQLPARVACTSLRTRFPEVGVAVLVDEEAPPDLDREGDAAPHAIIGRACPPESFFEALGAASLRRSFVDPGVVWGDGSSGRGAEFGVTQQELCVLQLLATSTNAGIARRLGISKETVKSQVARLLRKLGASSRAHAVAIGLSEGLITDRFPAKKPGAAV